MENVRKLRNIKLVTIERRRKYLVEKPNYHTTRFFHRNFISNRNEKKKKTQMLMNKLVYLGLSILSQTE